MIRYYQGRYRCVACVDFDRVTKDGLTPLARCQRCGEPASLLESCTGWAKAPTFTEYAPLPDALLFGDMDDTNQAGKTRRRESVSLRSDYIETCRRTSYKTAWGARTQAVQMERQHARAYAVEACEACHGYHLEPLDEE